MNVVENSHFPIMHSWKEKIQYSITCISCSIMETIDNKIVSDNFTYNKRTVDLSFNCVQCENKKTKGAVGYFIYLFH